MTAQFPTLDALTDEIREMGTHSAEYWDKQVHRVPTSQVVDRLAYLTKHATGKTVLHVGCTGVLDQALCKVATRCYGIDSQPLTREHFEMVDLDRVATTGLPIFEGVDLIVCGEVLEHLSNPGYFLESLRRSYPTVPVVLTVPNAFSEAGQSWLLNRGRENVHREHVCYYSYTTLATLLARTGYTSVRHFWYGGKPYISEGLIMVAEPQKD